MTLATSQIYYYGINEKTLEMEISSFAYSSEKNCYIASDCQPVFCDEFVREVKKEVLYLRESFQITDKKTCKVCDLSSPLYSMVGFNTVRSVKDCPTAYRLLLVP